MRRTLRPLLALLVAVVLTSAAAGCGGDDGGGAEAEATSTTKASSASSSGGDTEEFCLAIDEVKVAGQALSDVRLEEESDLPAAKAALTDLIEALDAALEVAPEEISDVTAEVAGFSAQVQERVDSAETIEDLREEIPLLVSVLADNTAIDDAAQAEFAEFVGDACGL